MDKQVEQQNKEAIKMTMLMHDRILKQQVKELHRLYDVQRKLMCQFEKETNHPGPLNFDDSQSSAKETGGELTNTSFTLVNSFDLERRSLEKNKGPDTNIGIGEASSAEGIGTSGMNGKDDDDDDEDEVVDLALSIGLGGGSTKKRA